MIYLSCSGRLIGAQNDETLGQQLGKANYSYAFALKKFASALALAEIEFTQLAHPSLLPSAPKIAVNRNPVHLAFYPPDELRLLKGARNILVFAWEFSTLRSAGKPSSSHAFSNHEAMLELVSAVWTPSSYAADVIRRHTKTPVEIVPAPISSNFASFSTRIDNRLNRQAALLKALERLQAVSLTIFPRYQLYASELSFLDRFSITQRLRDALSIQRPIVYLSVINPHDARKGMLHAINAFCHLAQTFPHAIWIIKTSSHDDTLETINTRLFTHQIARESELAGQYISDNIWICNEALTDEELNALYALADYYLCTSHAEGQNLPLLEAMGTGAVPISVNHTAMSDYIDKDNSVIISSARVPLPPDIARKYGLFDAYWYETTFAEVYNSLEYSALLPREEYHRLSFNAFSTVAEDFSTDAVLSRINLLLDQR